MNCVYCGSCEDLNTVMTIVINDGDKVSVHICDLHAEEATVKTARIAYLDKQSKIEEVLKQARSLGLNISINDSGFSIASASTPVKVQPVQQPILNEAAVQEPDDDFIQVNTVFDRPITVAGADQSAGYTASGFTDRLDENLVKGKGKITVAEGRDGSPIAFLSSRVDGTGTTRIVIKNQDDDQKLQNRFKKLAEASIRDKAPDFVHAGYQDSMVSCSFCRGESTVKKGQEIIMCPKCNGSGMISKY